MQTVERAPEVVTSSLIARLLSVSRNRVIHVLRTRPHIAPEYRAGNARLYPKAAISQVRHELNAIDARQASSSGDDGGTTLFDANGKGGDA